MRRVRYLVAGCLLFVVGGILLVSSPVCYFVAGCLLLVVGGILLVSSPVCYFVAGCLLLVGVLASIKSSVLILDSCFLFRKILL